MKSVYKHVNAYNEMHVIKGVFWNISNECESLSSHECEGEASPRKRESECRGEFRFFFWYLNIKQKAMIRNKKN